VAWQDRNVLIGGQVKFTGGRWWAEPLETMRGQRVTIKYDEAAYGALYRVVQGEDVLSERYYPEVWTSEANHRARRLIGRLSPVRKAAAADSTASTDPGGKVLNAGDEMAMEMIAIEDERAVVTFAAADALTGIADALVSTRDVREGEIIEGFDYGGLGDEALLVVRQAEEEIEGVIRQSSITIGRNLINVKAVLRHGQWERWLRSRWGWSADKAQNYMRHALLASQHPAIAAHSELFDTSALTVLSAKGTPATAVEEAADRAAQGQRITNAAAKALVDAHKGSQETITIHTQDGSRQVYPVARAGMLALTPATTAALPGTSNEAVQGRVTITHVPSGLCIPVILEDNEQTRATFLLLAEEDWSGVRGNKVPEPLAAKIRELLNLPPRPADVPLGVAAATPRELIPDDWSEWFERAALLSGGALSLTERGIVILVIKGQVQLREQLPGVWEKVCRCIRQHERECGRVPGTTEYPHPRGEDDPEFLAAQNRARAAGFSVNWGSMIGQYILWRGTPTGYTYYLADEWDELLADLERFAARSSQAKADAAARSPTPAREHASSPPASARATGAGLGAAESASDEQPASVQGIDPLEDIDRFEEAARRHARRLVRLVADAGELELLGAIAWSRQDADWTEATPTQWEEAAVTMFVNALLLEYDSISEERFGRLSALLRRG